MNRTLYTLALKCGHLYTPGCGNPPFLVGVGEGASGRFGGCCVPVRGRGPASLQCAQCWKAATLLGWGKRFERRGSALRGTEPACLPQRCRSGSRFRTRFGPVVCLSLPRLGFIAGNVSLADTEAVGDVELVEAAVGCHPRHHVPPGPLLFQTLPDRAEPVPGAGEAAGGGMVGL